MPPDGTCPTCGRVIAEPPDDSIPWHFWLLAVAVIVYLGWRYVQLLQWLDGNGHGSAAIGLGVVTLALVAWGVVVFVRRDKAVDDEGAVDDGGSASIERGQDPTGEP